MVVKGHGDAAGPEMFGDVGQLGSEILPVAGSENRSARQFGRAIVADAAGGLGKDHDLAAKGDEQHEMILDRCDFRLDRALEQPPAVPAGDEGEAVPIEDRAQGLGAARKLVAELDACIAGKARLGETRLERRLAAEFGQIVVGPGDRIDPDTHAHSVSLRGGPLAVLYLAVT